MDSAYQNRADHDSVDKNVETMDYSRRIDAGVGAKRKGCFKNMIAKSQGLGNVDKLYNLYVFYGTLSNQRPWSTYKPLTRCGCVDCM
jgi:hypothetical protein